VDAQTVTVSERKTARGRVWPVSFAVSLAIPAAIFAMQFLGQFLPISRSGTAVQRYCIYVTEIPAAEWVIKGTFLLVQKPGWQGLKAMGLFRAGTVVNEVNVGWP
jgi:hypothetical protein